MASNRYETHRDVAYHAGPSQTAYMRERCFLDVYYPTHVEDFATVVWFHGGGLNSGEREVPAWLRRKRLAVVAVDYRLSPRAKSPAYLEDAAAAVAWVFRHIASYGGDPGKIFVSGHSAGGYLASMLGLDKRWLAAHDVDADSLAGLAPLSGHAITHFTIREERGIPETRAVVDDLAPLFHVRSEAPPMVLITGDREMEMLGRYEENAYMARMMRLAGHPRTELLELAGFDHGQMAEAAGPLLVRFVRERWQRDSLRDVETSTDIAQTPSPPLTLHAAPAAAVPN